MIEILSSAALASVQDLGRHGSLRDGVGTSGAMDDLALAAGNLMLGNPAGAAGIEVPIFPFELRFERDTAFAVTGGHGEALLDGHPLPPWWSAQARAGQKLRLRPPHQGARAYLTVAGGIAVPEVLGSRSTQLRGAFGGHEGRALHKGDRLPVGEAPGGPSDWRSFGLAAPSLVLPVLPQPGCAQPDGCVAVRAIPAAEYEVYTEASRHDFWQQEWKLTPQSDRYGYRLEGQALVTRHTIETRSHGIVPGVIQVPHGGQPIIQMRDAQPSGGYPKIATVIEADLWRLAQAPIGSRVRFVEVGYAQAIEALEDNARYLREAARLASLYRGLQRPEEPRP